MGGGVDTYKVENTNIKTQFVKLDKSHEKSVSFDLDSSFQHAITHTPEKLNKVFGLAQRVNEEIEHILTDKNNLPPSLKVKMPEFNNIVAALRSLVVSRSFISTKVFEKRMAKDATKMLSTFLFHVLRENQAIILRQT